MRDEEGSYWPDEGWQDLEVARRHEHARRKVDERMQQQLVLRQVLAHKYSSRHSPDNLEEHIVHGDLCPFCSVFTW